MTRAFSAFSQGAGEPEGSCGGGVRVPEGRSTSISSCTKVRLVPLSSCDDTDAMQKSGSDVSEGDDYDLSEVRVVKSMGQRTEDFRAPAPRLPSEKSGSSDRSSRVRWALQLDHMASGSPSSEECTPAFTFARSCSSKTTKPGESPAALRKVPFRKTTSERRAGAEEFVPIRKSKSERYDADEQLRVSHAASERSASSSNRICCSRSIQHRNSRMARLAEAFGPTVLERETEESTEASLPVLLGSKVIVRSQTQPDLGDSGGHGKPMCSVGSGSSSLRPPSPAGLLRRRTVDYGNLPSRPTTPSAVPRTPDMAERCRELELLQDYRLEPRQASRHELLEPLPPLEFTGARSRKRSSPAVARRSSVGRGGTDVDEAWASPALVPQLSRDGGAAPPRFPSRRSPLAGALGERFTSPPLGRCPSVVSTPEATAPARDRRRQLAPEARLEIPPLPFGDKGPGPPAHNCSTGSKQEGGKFAWKKGRRLGSGSYGCVFAALSDDGYIFAVKQSSEMEDSAEGRKHCEKLEEELRICRNLRHQNIVSYLGHDWLDNQLYLYLEYMPGGSMAAVLNDFGKLQQKQLAKASKDLLTGLDYLHTREPPVVHRDIKGANLLVNLNFDVKLSDFGLSRRNYETRSLTMLGSIPWMAPEVIQQQDGHGRKADIWSSGCTIIEMATAEKPWGNGAFDNVVYALRHIGMTEALPAIPEDIAAECQDLLRQCVQRSPDCRPSAKKVLRHAFLREGINDEFK